MEEQIPFRVRTPRGKQVIGLVTESLGGSRFRIACLDNKERICRIPVRSKRNMWVKLGDHVLVEPWEIEPEVKGDIVFRYKPNEVGWMRRKEIIK